MTIQTRPDYPIVVHSHLGWDWVWQRPQQFLSRLSRKHRILFVEQHPLFTDKTDEAPRNIIRQLSDYPNITVLQMQFPKDGGDAAWMEEQRRQLLRKALRGPLAGKFDKPVQWFYDPMAVATFGNFLDEIAVVYDCMDELSKFKFADPELVQRERLLLSMADVVFTGGRKMYESKIRYNDNCHFYGCGVDVDHYSKARSRHTALPEDIANLEGPVLGYFGVVDERMDYELIERLADANPNWHIVIVGPTAKVDPNDLPQRENIHWMGGRDYAQLPAYTKGFDVCMMPFALNESTEYINPTKALEYMAGGKPIVSTAVPDVVSNFSQVVKIAASQDEFITLCEAILARPDQVAIERGLKMAQANTWDAIVAKLEGHINDVLKSQAEAARVASGQLSASVA